MGKISCRTAALFAAAGLAFAAPPPKKPRIAVLMYGNKAEFVQLMQRYGRQHPAVTGGLAEITFYDGRYDSAVQNDQAQLAINSKADAIIVNPMDFEANIEVVKESHGRAHPGCRYECTAEHSGDDFGGRLRRRAGRLSGSKERAPEAGL